MSVKLDDFDRPVPQS